MYTKGILERYAASLDEPIDQAKVRAAIALIIFDGQGNNATCGGADVEQIFELPALQHLASDFQSRWICFVQQGDLEGLSASVSNTGTEQL